MPLSCEDQNAPGGRSSVLVQVLLFPENEVDHPARALVATLGSAVLEHIPIVTACLFECICHNRKASKIAILIGPFGKRHHSSSTPP
jgi:hypothetical protein